MGAIKHDPNETAEENNARAEAMKKHLEEVYKPKDRDIVMRVTKEGYELFEKLIRDEAKKLGIEYPETRESSLLNPVEGDSRQVKDSLQEEDM